MIDLSWGEVNKSVEGPVPGSKVVSGENVQGSEAWLQWRGKGIGSSDAAVLLGWSPWKKIEQLYEEKLGLWKPVFGFHQKAAMERGKDLEPKIREWYEHTVNALFPDDISTHPEHEYMRASFDGINRLIKNEDGSTGRIIEIKAPNMKDHTLAKDGTVTEKYNAQIQWLMLVANVNWCDYVSYGSDDTYAVVHVKADPSIQKELTMRSDLFWKHVQTKTPILQWEKYECGLSEPLNLFPVMAGILLKKRDELAKATITEITKNAEFLPGLSPQEDPPQITDQAIEALVAEALLCQQEADQAAARFEAKKERLKQVLGKEEKMEKDEAVFGWQKRKGNVDYSVIPELVGLDLEQFRKPETRAFYFKRKSQK